MAPLPDEAVDTPTVTVRRKALDPWEELWTPGTVFRPDLADS
jgi:hypothetical protein